ncbi:MAG TPA: hypothetical protein VFJ85_19225 [Acidimicrobiales bacterium]|nr:hypothetical protein [Acidimicrobiales bacterium]
MAQTYQQPSGVEWKNAEEQKRDGWLFFAGTILGIAGIMRLFDAAWAFGYHGALPDKLQDGLLGENLQNYGWLWLMVGIVLLLTSFLVVSRSQLARWVGIVGAVIGGVSAVAWMPYYPVWSLVYVGMAVLVIYALSVYGARDRQV